MAMKIDLEKAYDKIEWSFIKEMMVRINLPTSLIDIIISYVFTVSISILINGETTDPIFPSRETPFPLICLFSVWNTLVNL